jgi:putative glutamine amidotransferase
VRPAVGITTSYAADREMFTLRDDYVRAVEATGALPLALAPGRPEDVGDLLDRVQALVFTGGVDVQPALYGASPHPTVTEWDAPRDAFELALCREGIRRDLPILAICRGHQVLNVATGGTLVQDIPSELAGALNHDPGGVRWTMAHEVAVQPGTRLHQILGRDHLPVNSIHHQAIAALGQGLVVSALGEDGVIEGVEMPARRFVLGVQWHPESFWDQGGAFHTLFDALVAEARGR